VHAAVGGEPAGGDLAGKDKGHHRHGRLEWMPSGVRPVRRRKKKEQKAALSHSGSSSRDMICARVNKTSTNMRAFQ